MAKIRRSKTDTRMFIDIPKEHELDDENKLRKKYKKTFGVEVQCKKKADLKEFAETDVEKN